MYGIIKYCIGFFKKTTSIFQFDDKQITRNLNTYFSGLSSKFSFSYLKGFLNSDVKDFELFKQGLYKSLIKADVGLNATEIIISKFEKFYTDYKKVTAVTSNKKNIEFKEMFSQFLSDSLAKDLYTFNLDKLNVIILCGVNGVGKTTTIPKLIKHLCQKYDLNSIDFNIAACDTYRAAAFDQIKYWADLLKVNVFDSGSTKDPGAILYKAIDFSLEKKHKFLIVDTSGRIHNNTNLMNQLSKMVCIVKKKHDVLYKHNFLILDSITGNIAIDQASAFNSTVNIDRIILTKFDSSAKGGVILSSVFILNKYIEYLCIGEGLDDFLVFNKKEFIKYLL